MPSDGLCHLSAAEIAAGLRRRSFSAVELIDANLRRIEETNDLSRAYIAVTAEDARRRALECDRRIATGDDGHPLLGVPFATKDLIDIAGTLTTGGSRVLHDNVASADAPVVARLFAAGAIGLGKTNLHEFAYGITGENEHFGTPVNAYDAAHLATGSSSGSAAAIAFGTAAAALGTDTGGSVRVPAVLNGLVGLKPTHGRIPLTGIVPYCWTLDHVGLLTRTVGDCSALLAVCGDREHPLGSSADAARARPLQGVRIGVPDAGFLARTDPQILALMDQVRSVLEDAGASIRDVPMPDLRYARTASLVIQMPEALSFHSPYLAERGDLYGADFRAGLALGQYLLAEQYIRAKRLVTLYRAEMQERFNEIDLLLTPATPIPAPRIGAVTVTLDGVEEPVGNALTRFTSFFNLTGHPALSMACGMHSGHLPIGVQFVGRYWRESAMFEAADVVERAFRGGVPRPPDGLSKLEPARKSPGP